MGGFQVQIDQLANEKAQLEAQISALQNQIQDLQQSYGMLQQQIGPLQQENAKLRQDLSYKDKRIQELQEPQPVMASSLASQPVGSPGATTGTAFGAPAPAMASAPARAPAMTSAPAPSIGAGSRRQCPNCGAVGFDIKEVEDRSKIVSYIPKPIYAKKNVCSKCGYEF